MSSANSQNAFGASFAAGACDLRERLARPPGPTEKFDPSADLLEWMMENLKTYGGIYKASMYGSDVYVVSEPKLIEHVLRDNWQNYRKGQAIKRIAMLLGNGLMVSEGELWRRRRKLIQPAFHQEAIHALLGRIAESARALKARWRDSALGKENINVTRDVSESILELVLRTLFGRDYESVKTSFSILSTQSERDLQFAQTFRTLRQDIQKIVRDRQRRAGADLDVVGMLMSAVDSVSGSHMPESQLVSEIMTLIVAGYETTVSVLCWTWYLLSQHPQTDARLAEEVYGHGLDCFTMDGLAQFTFVRQVLEETMRLYPPGWLMTRRALKDDYLGRYFVPANTEIYIAPYLVHRDPAIWDTPDSFDPDRFSPERVRERHPMAMLPFSAGPRKCIGELLARTEMQIYAVIIASEIRFRKKPPQPAVLTAGVNLRSRNDFFLEPEIRRAPINPNN